MREYIAYQGKAFQIEWYFDRDGHSQSLEYAEKQLSKVAKARLLLMFERLGEHGQIRDKTKFRNEGDGIFAFKPKPHRFLCFFFTGRKIIISNAFEKKQDKLPKQEKIRALSCMNEYTERVKKNDYYE